MQDLGFLSFTLPHVRSSCRRRSHAVRVALEQQLANQALHQRRLRIEHVNSSVKRCRIVKDRSRLWKEGVRDLVMEICCALHNFRVRLTPWRPRFNRDKLKSVTAPQALGFSPRPTSRGGSHYRTTAVSSSASARHTPSAQGGDLADHRCRGPPRVPIYRVTWYASPPSLPLHHVSVAPSKAAALLPVPRCRGSRYLRGHPVGPRGILR